MKNTVTAVLRVGTFGIFLGHGVYAFRQRPDWVEYLTSVGFSADTALSLMPVIGIVDFVVAVAVLVWTWRPAIIYAAIWAFLTASVRVWVGEEVWEFVERSGNWATPLALFLLLRERRG
ncbi:MAG: hypothetical protein AAF740_05680 [Bacteroidota bacterium]